MRQVIQNLRSGNTEVLDVPLPQVRAGHLLIRTTHSLISAGTERMLVEFSRANPIDRARQQPEKVRQVIDKARTEGVLTTLDAVRSKLDEPLQQGYCNVGIVEAVGAGVEGFEPGQRVASNGPHAEYVLVPKNLCAPIPEDVPGDEASFTVIGSIALQGIRLAQPTLGETFVVMGLGLVGQMAVQLLRANGCRVIGADFSGDKLRLAESFGAETIDLGSGVDAVAAAVAASRGRGVDGVIVAASTASSDPIHQAARMCRTRGRIVLVGVTGLELRRADFYEKELSFQVSCSYGPGRYDAAYEQGGQDYPYGLVRWTEQRNFEAVLDAMASGALKVAPLVSARFPIAEAGAAYDRLLGDKGALGLLLEYPQPSGEAAASPQRTLRLEDPQPAGRGVEVPRIAVIGAGNFAGRMLVPALREADASFSIIAATSGVNAAHIGRKFRFRTVTTEVGSVFTDPETDGVVVATRHDSHADYVCRALESGKNVFVEKPLAIREDELERIEAARAARPEPILTVGFNRRFAPHTVAMKRLVDQRTEPLVLTMTVNAGAIPPDHWTQRREVGGGRLIGEGCHFIDLFRFLVGAPVETAQALSVGGLEGGIRSDKLAVTLRYADGSLATLHYLANGHPSLPKERLEVFCAGRVLQLDNFRRLTSYGWPGAGRNRAWRVDKGHAACARAFVDAVRTGGPPPIPFDEIVETTRLCIELTDEIDRGAALTYDYAAHTPSEAALAEGGRHR